MQTRTLIHRPVFWTVAAIGLVALLVTIGIATTASGRGQTPDLVGRTFVSTDAHGRTLVESSTVTITFDEGHLSANAGCNTLFGGASWAGGTLDAPQLASTMMACTPALMDQDAWLGELLASGPTITLDGDTLTIGDTTSGLVLREVTA